MAKETLEPGEIEALLNELETKMGRLRALYEQYFLGIERTPPHVVRKDVVRIVFRIENLHIRNTALKFRARSLIQRFNSFKTYWTRVERQIEEGTYARDIRRAERNQERRQSRARRGEDRDDVVELDLEDGVVDLRDLEIELEALDADGAFDNLGFTPNEPQIPRPQQPAQAGDLEERKRAKLAQIAGALGIQDVTGASTRSAAPSTQPAPGSTTARRDKLAEIKRRMQARGVAVSDAPAPTPRAASSANDESRRVYEQLIEAKRRCNETTDNISFESVAKSLEKQRAKIKETRGSDVDFKVVIKDGRAFIKPETK